MAQDFCYGNENAFTTPPSFLSVTEQVSNQTTDQTYSYSPNAFLI